MLSCPLFLSFLSFCLVDKSFKAKYLHYTTSCLSLFFLLSPTHSFSLWMASMAVMLIVSSSSSSGSLFPHFIHPFADFTPSVEELGQGNAKIPVLFALFLYFTSPNFSLTHTNTLTHNIQHTIMSSLRQCM